MIKVSRIAGESYDLETGDKILKAIILTNGKREIAIQVSDEVITQILLMERESKGDLQANKPSELKIVTPSFVEQVTFEHAEPTDIPKDIVEPPFSYDREIGEEYNDPDTGVNSL